MKISLTIAIIILSVFISCKKDTALLPVINQPVSTTLSEGNFVSAVHPTSGRVRVVKNPDNKILLVFENFQTDSGPDLRIWLSANTSGNPYQEVRLLNGASGNFSIELDASFNYTTNNRVLIWCKQFTVLFGYAILQ